MDTFGRHMITDLWGCDKHKLNDRTYIEQVFVKAALEMGAEIREVAFHKFAPYGVSGVVIISESHLSIHSFPEHCYASVDVYTCGGLNPYIAIDYITESLNAKMHQTLDFTRGKEPYLVEVI